MERDNEILVTELVAKVGGPLGLVTLAGAVGLNVVIQETNVERPGLALAGFVDYFRPGSVHVIGQTELTYMATLDEDTLMSRWRNYLAQRPAALIVARSLELPAPLVAVADEIGVALLGSPLMTDVVIHKLENYLERELAPTSLMHGVLMDIFGLGVLILGESGVGKSESALELLQRGHRLVSDDIVEIRRVRYDRLVGTSPSLTKHHIEIRGLGILNIRQLYGAAAVVDEMHIDLVAQLELWREGFEYDRLGLEQETVDILGIEIPTMLIPVQPGRNITVIIEVGSMNQRLKNMGVHAAAEFNARLNSMLMPAAPSQAPPASAPPVSAPQVGAPSSRQTRGDD